MIYVGLVGAGRRGRDHLKTLALLDDVKIKAICDVNETLAKNVAKEYNANHYTSYKKMLEEETLDAIFICTPTNVHVSQAIEAVKRSINFLMEKPISLKLSETIELVKTVKEYGVVGAVGYQSRYLDVIQKAIDILKSYKVSMVNAHYYWTIPIIGWIRKRELGGGQIVDQSTHLIDLFRYVVDEIESVYAAYSSIARSTEEDKRMGFENWDSYALTIRFKGGAVGTLSGTYALFPGIKDSSGIDFIARELLVRYIHGSRLEVIRREDTTVYIERLNPTLEMDKDFIEAVRRSSDKDLRVSLEKTFRSHIVALAANESATTGKVINIDELIGEID